MNKAYTRINFQNAPSTATPLNATNLNKMDKAINDLDDRIIELSGYQEEAEESAEMASASASAAAKAAETATADAEARVNEVIQGLEVYTKADSHKKFASVIKQVATGSPILIKDSSDAGVLDFKAYGRSEQKQYSGKNMLAPTLATATSNGITCTNNGNGTYTLNGTSTDATYFNLAANYQLNAGTYKFVGVPSAINGLKIYQGSIPNAPVDSGNGVTFSLDSDISNYKPFIEVLSGKTLSNVIIKPMLTTDLEATYNTFEPYVGGTASPNPNYPQAIKSVADGGYFDGELLQGDYNTSNGEYRNLRGYVCGKNPIPCKSGDIVNIVLEDLTTNIYIYYHNDNGFVSSTYKLNTNSAEFTIPSGITSCKLCIGSGSTNLTNAPHITVTINGKYALIVKSNEKNLLNINASDKDTKFFSYTKYTNEIVKATATKTSVGEFICSFSVYLAKGKTYTFSHESINGMMQVYIYYDKLWGNRVCYLNIPSTPNYTHNADSGIYIIGYFGAITSGTEYSIVKPMLRRAEVTDGTYEPYKEEVKYIPLNEPLRSSLDGTVTDEVSLSDNKITRKFTEVVFDGSDDELWTYNGQYFYNSAITTNTAKDNAICTQYTFVNTHTSILAKDNVFGIRTFGICFNNTSITTLDQWKTQLQANPITVIYELAEPIIEKIEPVDIVTYDNVTYLTASDNADMEVTYATDTKSYIDSKFAELHAALVNML